FCHHQKLPPSNRSSLTKLEANSLSVPLSCVVVVIINITLKLLVQNSSKENLEHTIETRTEKEEIGQAPSRASSYYL
ncbi:hypothetical protein Gotur_016027, partial [Gossypium turneri]